MATASGTDVRYTIGADTTKYDRAMDHIRSVGTSTTDALIKGFKGLGIAGAAAIGAMVVSGTKSMAELDRLTRRTQSLIKATGDAAGITADEMISFAKALDLATLADRNQIIESINVLQTFKSVQGDVFKRAIRLSQDLSETLGVDLRGQTVQLGKALEDPITGLTALRRVGVTFTDSEKEVIKALTEANKKFEAQGKILDAIQGQVGGAGEAAAGGLSGSIDTLSYRWRDFKEALTDTDAAVGGINAINKSLEKTTEILKSNAFKKGSSDFFATMQWLVPGGRLAGKVFGSGGDKDKKQQQFNGGFPPMAEGGAGFSGWSPGGAAGQPSWIEQAKNMVDSRYIDSWMKPSGMDAANERANAMIEIQEAQYEREKELEQLRTDAFMANAKKQTEFFESELNRRYQKEKEMDDAVERSKEAAELNYIQNREKALEYWGKQSKGAFEKFKVYKTAEATVATIDGTVKAWNAGMSTGGPWAPAVAASYAAAAFAWGMARVDAIQNMSYGGGSGGGAGGGGGSVGTYPVDPVTGVPQTDPAYAKDDKRGTINLYFEGDFIGDEAYIEKIIDGINDAEDRDVYINKTKYARELDN